MAGSLAPVSRYRFSSVSISEVDDARNATFRRDGAWSGNISVRSSRAASGSSLRMAVSTPRITTVVTAAMAPMRSTASTTFGAGGTISDSTNAATTEIRNGMT